MSQAASNCSKAMSLDEILKTPEYKENETTTEPIRVRYGETDMMGHVYYANYLFWFEQARGAWCRDRGFTYKELEQMGYKLPAVEAHLTYHAEVKYDDVVHVRVWLSELKRSSMRFDYEVYNTTNDKVTTRGYTWHVLVGSSMKAVAIPAEVRELLLRSRHTF